MRKLLHAESQWGVPLLASALGGLLFPSARHTSRNLRWLFHWWLLAGIIFYGFGARELTDNPWNFHIIDPALAGLAGQGLLVASAALARLHVPLSGRAAVILIIVSLHSLQMRQHLRLSYTAYARQSYEMGATLAQISQPTDLVVTVSNAIGDPVAIYYSHRRGWVFPPPWPGVKWWWVDPADELVSIELFDKLRSNGARWFGIVAEQKPTFVKPHLGFWRISRARPN